MYTKSNDPFNENDEAAEGATSTTSWLSKNPVDQNKATDSTAIVTEAPPEGKRNDSTESLPVEEGGGEGDDIVLFATLRREQTASNGRIEFPAAIVA